MTAADIVQIGSAGAHADEELARRYAVASVLEGPIPSDLGALAPEATVVVTSALRGITRGMIDSLPKLRAICSWGVGYDTLDVAAAREKGIAVSYTPDILDDCVADLAWALMLAVGRRIAEADRYVKAGAWQDVRGFPEAMRISGKRLGILGMGRIGEAIARRGAGFDMQIGYHNRRAKDGAPGQFFDTLEGLAAWADVLVVACPGGAATYHLVNAPVLDALGPKGILINIARGSVVDETALAPALQEGRLGGAGLDVFEDEPNVPAALMGFDRVVLTPHIGSCTVDTRRAMGDLVVANVEKALAGEPLVTPIP